MCPMKGGGMMSGGMGGKSDSPLIMETRSGMLKAMGEVMVKYGKMTSPARSSSSAPRHRASFRRPAICSGP